MGCRNIKQDLKEKKYGDLLKNSSRYKEFEYHTGQLAIAVVRDSENLSNVHFCEAWKAYEYFDNNGTKGEKRLANEMIGRLDALIHPNSNNLKIMGAAK